MMQIPRAGEVEVTTTPLKTHRHIRGADRDQAIALRRDGRGLAFSGRLGETARSESEAECTDQKRSGCHVSLAFSVRIGSHACVVFLREYPRLIRPEGAFADDTGSAGMPPGVGVLLQRQGVDRRVRPGIVLPPRARSETEIIHRSRSPRRRRGETR